RRELEARSATNDREGALLGKTSESSSSVASVTARRQSGSKATRVTVAPAATAAHHTRSPSPSGRVSRKLTARAAPSDATIGTTHAAVLTSLASAGRRSHSCFRGEPTTHPQGPR